MNEYALIYSPELGLGVPAGNRQAVLLRDGSVRPADSSSFVPVDASLTEALEEGNLGSYDWGTRSRAREYINGRDITAVRYLASERSVTALVHGTSYYKTTLRLSRGRIVSNCSCPVRTNCKHGYALAEYLRTRLSIACDRCRELEAGLPRGERSVEGKLRELSAGADPDLVYCAQLAALLREGEQSERVDELFDGLDRIPAASRSAGRILGNLLYDEALRPALLNHAASEDGESPACRRCLELYPAVREELDQSGEAAEEGTVPVFGLRARFLSGDADGYCRLLARTLRGRPSWGRVALYVNCLSYLPEGSAVSEETAGEIAAAVLEERLPAAVAGALTGLLGPEERKAVYLDERYGGPIPQPFLDGLPDEEAASIAWRMDPKNSEERMRLVERLRHLSAVCPAELARLYESTPTSYPAALKKQILNAAGELPDSSCFVEYLGMKLEGYAYAYSGGVVKAQEMPEGFWTYFTLSYEVGEVVPRGEGFGCSVTYRASSPCGETVLELRDPVFSEEDGDQLWMNVFRFAPDNEDVYCRGLMDGVADRFGEQLRASLAAAAQEVEQLSRQAKTEELRDAMRRYADGVAEKRILLAPACKASLAPAFTFGEQEALLSFRVGNRRKYVVQDAEKFLKGFDREETHFFGKNLELTYTLSNFDERSAQMLGVLLRACPPAWPVDRRQLRLNPFATQELLEILKGTAVTVDGEEYLAAMEEIRPEIRIEAGYVLRCSLSSCRLFRLPGGLLVQDLRRRRLDRITCGSREAALFSFAVSYDGTDLSPVAEEFKEKIYAENCDSIRVDESLQEEFRRSELVIRAYFDYQDGEILKSERLTLDGRELLPQELTRPADLHRFGLYASYLEGLGFWEDRLTEDADVLSFMKMDFSELRRLCEVYLSESLTGKQIVLFTPGVIRVKYDNGLMSALVAGSPYTDEELEAVLRALRRKKKYVLLDGDRIVELDSPEAETFARAVDDMGLDPSALHEEKRISMVSALKSLAYAEHCETDEYLSRMAEDIRGFKDAPFELPQLEIPLRSYQQEGFRWLKTLSSYGMGGILADDMGLGKTLQIIALIASDPVEQPSLIVCPKSLIFNWKNEFARFCPGIPVTEVYGPAPARKAVIDGIGGERRVYVTAYDSLRNDAALYKDIRFAYAVLDEAQFIKNVDAKKSRNVKLVQADHRFALTGTPIENNVIDLWSIFDFVLPGYLEELNTYKTVYGDQDSDLTRLSRKVAPFILRRTKKEVLQDLPEKFERILTTEMGEEQRKVYDAYVMRARQKLEEGGKAFDMLPFLMRLRQICVDPGTFLGEYGGGSCKLEELEQLLDAYLPEGHKILVFSQFVKALSSVEQLLQKKGIPYFLLTGDTPAKDRVSMAEKFNTGDGVRIFLISLKAGGTGLNLTGADTVLHLDPWWNAAAEDQATDRAHRIGQTRNVEVIKLICSDTIEQRVIELQNIKKDIIDRVISDDDSSITDMRLEDIAFILD